MSNFKVTLSLILSSKRQVKNYIRNVKIMIFLKVVTIFSFMPEIYYFDS